MPIFKPKRRIAIRVYGQGFGDCILIAIRPKVGTKAAHILIDCGVFFGTTGKNDRLREVIAHVRESTAGKLKVLAITHEHYDHVAGWDATHAAWNDYVAVEQLWQSWTERPDDEFAKLIKDGITYKFKMAAAMASPAAMAALGDNEPAFGLNVKFSKLTGEALKKAVKFAKDRGAVEKYWDPGNVETWSNDCQFVFMGPPRNKDLLFQDLWKSGEPHLSGLGMEEQTSQIKRENARMEKKLGAAGDEELTRIRAALGLDVSAPFDERFALMADDPRWEKIDKGVRDRYLDPKNKWRALDNLADADVGKLALQMDNLTNNTSLVFAIRLKDEYFLFVGDAQVGNWYGFDKQTYDLGTAVVTSDEILGKTHFYKCGHHGSHNATMIAKGLDKMPQGMVTIVPTEPGAYNGVPQEHPLMEELEAKGPMMRTDLAENRDPFIAGPMSAETGRPLYVEYHAP